MFSLVYFMQCISIFQLFVVNDDAVKEMTIALFQETDFYLQFDFNRTVRKAIIIKVISLNVV